MFSSFEQLEVWKECRKLRLMISNLSKLFPAYEKYKLTDQIVRASHSPCANIAEGHGRYHFQENIQFCRIARGSLSETHNRLINALDEKYISNDDFEIHVNQIKLSTRLLNGYINYLEKQKVIK